MATTHPRCFLLLPPEIHIKILLRLDSLSLIRCSSVCRDLAMLISSDLSLQYEFQLAKAGMIGDPVASATIPLSERVEQVKAYRVAWQIPKVVVDTRFPQRPDRLRLIPMTSGALPFATGPQTLHLWKPGSSLRGVPEVRVSCSGALLNIRYSSISVDLEQDLVVLTAEAWHPGTFSVAEYRVHLLTTAGIPHPLAALPEPRGPGQFLPPPHSTRVVSTTDIYGDLVAWSASTNPGQILVWNWKTGDGLLRITPNVPGSCFKFLDESHLLVLFDQDLRIYNIPSSLSSGIQNPPAPPLTINDCPFVLPLPSFAHEAVRSMDPKLYMPNSPSSFSTPPLFRQDPTMAVVCVAFGVASMAREDPLDRVIEHYAFLLPLSALLTQCQGDKAVPRDIPWEEWGPRSCRVLKTIHVDSLGVSGTKVVMWKRQGWDSDGRRARMQVQVVDINPCAQNVDAHGIAQADPPAPSTPSTSPTRIQMLADPGEDSCIADCRFFRRGSVRSELPYTTATHEVSLELEDGADPRRNGGRHEMFVFEDQWMFLYTERPGAATQFTATGVHTMKI